MKFNKCIDTEPITLRQFFRYILPEKYVAILAEYSQIYYEGQSGLVPEELYDCEIKHITAWVRYNEDTNSPHRYRAVLGLCIGRVITYEQNQ